MDLKSVVKKLQEFAPLKTAEKWDNVGLLVEPYTPKEVKKMFLTNDLTETVLEEAFAKQANFIFSYHPPIFSPLKKLTTQSAKERIIVRAIEERVAIYSPHTAVDSLNGGVNDWLAEGLGDGAVSVIQPFSYLEPTEALKVVVFVPEQNADKIREEMSKAGAGNIGNYSQCSFNIEGKGSFFANSNTNPVVGSKGQLNFEKEVRLEMVCSRSKLGAVAEAIKRTHPYETPAWEVYSLEASPVEGTGQGRLVTLKEPQTVTEMVNRIKKHLGLTHVRLALSSHGKSADEVKVKTIALCAGAGESVIAKVKADMFFTGEMRHHEVLAAVESGTSVVLCDHSNTERGYLKVLQGKLSKLLDGKVEIEVSTTDHDPLVIV